MSSPETTFTQHQSPGFKTICVQASAALSLATAGSRLGSITGITAPQVDLLPDHEGSIWVGVNPVSTEQIMTPYQAAHHLLPSLWQVESGVAPNIGLTAPQRALFARTFGWPVRAFVLVAAAPQPTRQKHSRRSNQGSPTTHALEIDRTVYEAMDQTGQVAIRTIASTILEATREYMRMQRTTTSGYTNPLPRARPRGFVSGQF